MTYFKHCVASPWSATQSCMAIGKRQQTESLKSELCQQDPTWRHGSEAKWVPYFHCSFLLLKHCSWDAPLALHPALKNWSKRKTHQVNTKGLHSCDLIWCSLSACKKGKKKENLKQKVLGEWWISKCRVAVKLKNLGLHAHWPLESANMPGVHNSVNMNMMNLVTSYHSILSNKSKNKSFEKWFRFLEIHWHCLSSSRPKGRKPHLGALLNLFLLFQMQWESAKALRQSESMWIILFVHTFI